MDIFDNIYERRESEVISLLSKSPQYLEARDHKGATPLIVSCGTNQFVLAEALVRKGANIWAHSEFGVTAFEMIDSEGLNEVEYNAQQRLNKFFRASGYQDSMTRRVVLAMDAEGNWPPKNAKKRPFQ